MTAQLHFTFPFPPVIVARMWRSISVLGVIGLLVGGCATERSGSIDKAPEPYVRVSEPLPGVVKLEIAARRFAPRRGNGPSIWLTGASHLGDAEYYRALQTHLDAQTLVLFEGVGGDDVERGPRRRHQPDSSRTAPGGADAKAGSLQEQMAKSLGLEFQLEAIEYDRSHFKNSDLNVEELRALMADEVVPPRKNAGMRSSKETPRSPEEREPVAVASPSARTDAGRSFEQLMQVMEGESFFGRLLSVGLRWLGTQPRYQALAKFTLMEMINGVQGDLESVGALPAGMRELLRVLIDERNQRVVSDLRRELPSYGARDSISVFYGAGHMIDLEQRLRQELRYQPREEIWFTAMTVDAAKAGLTSAELATTRKMIQRQIATLRAQAARPP